jgi:hypothetical protein
LRHDVEVADGSALERLRIAIRDLDGPRTIAELRCCQAGLATDAWFQTIAEYALRRLRQPADGHADAGGTERPAQLAAGPLQQVLGWLLREEVDTATRLFRAGRFAETRRVCERGARIDGRCARLALLRGLAMARDAPEHWSTLLEARRWLTVAATDPALREQCRVGADRLDDALGRRERAEVNRLNDSYTGIWRVYDRPRLHHVEAVNLRASLVTLGGKVERARGKCRPGTPAARSLESLARAVTGDIAMLTAKLGL